MAGRIMNRDRTGVFAGRTTKVNRAIMATTASATLLVALAACTASSGESSTVGDSESDVVLTWQTTGGPATEKEKEAFQDPYTAESGVTFENVSSPTAVNQVTTMVETGNVIWDIVHIGSYVSEQYCGELFEEIEYPEVDDSLYPEGSVNACAKPISKFAYAFAYNASIYTDEVPTKIDDFFDIERFPGNRVVNGNNPRGLIEAALVADGVDPDELFPLDVERALAKLDTIKEHLIFAPTLTALQQNIVDEQAAMTITLTGRLGSIYDSGADLAPVWDFTTWDFDALLIPKGSPNVDAAREAILFAMQPEQSIRYAEVGGTTPVRSDIDITTIDYSDTHRLFQPFLNADQGTLVLQNPQWWAENSATTNEAYVAWQVG
ncbi:extracellular solute-binding protein [Microbacterium sp.]|uniref:extracellular solute-binding protein n=1 Tax=Microbacterium sp. TaxID=51671 RepID=UPI002736DE2E|nr:extracellular solute-binding protein [Microbacterium sp.]